MNEHEIPNEKYSEEEVQTLINDINSYPEYSLLEKVISYCEENEIDVNDIQDILKQSEHFRTVFYIDCVEKNHIRDLGLKRKLTETIDEDEW